MTKEEKYELIERYLNEEISKEAFQDLVKANPDLEQELTLHSEIERYIANRDLDNFTKFVKETIDEEQTNQNGLYPRLYYGIAAALLIGLLTISYFYIFQTTQNDLFVAYFEPYEGIGVLRGPGSDMAFAQAMQFYEEGNFEQAIVAFQDAKDHELSNFYLGVSHLALGNADKAISQLANYRESDNILKNPADWYTSLAYLLKNDLEQSKVLLTGLEENPYWGHKARDLLQDIGQ